MMHYGNLNAGVGQRGKLCEWQPYHPAFLFSAWAQFNAQQLSPAEIGRHTKVLGETGSGKSKSAMMPISRAALCYPEPAPYAAYRSAVAGFPSADIEARDQLQPSMLVVDPKGELCDYIQAVNDRHKLKRDIVEINPHHPGPKIHLFEGADTGNLTHHQILERILSLNSYHDASRLDHHNVFWNDQARDVVLDLLSVDVFLHRRGGVRALANFWAAVKNLVIQRVAADVEREKTTSQPAVPFDWRSDEQDRLLDGLNALSLEYNRGNFLFPYYVLMNSSALHHRFNSGLGNSVLNGYAEACSAQDVPASLTLQFTSLTRLAPETFGGIQAFVNSLLKILSADALAASISLNPFEPPEFGALSIHEAMNSGRVVIYCPAADSPIADMIGRAIKAKFFEFTFTRRNRIRPFFYICDEFQRFITKDPTSGEQSFLDRCRAYRGVCALATQSVASLLYELSDSANDEGAHSLEIILNNTGNSLFFRNTDLETQHRAASMIPSPHSAARPHVLAARPLSTLRVGECYYVLSNNTWGRGQALYPVES